MLEVNQANQADYTAATPGELAEANAAVAALKPRLTLRLLPVIQRMLPSARRLPP